MGKLVYSNGHVTVNSVDLSDHATQFALDRTADAQESTAFNSGGNREYLGGLKGATGSITFRQDFASSSVDDSLNALLGTTVAIAARPVNTTISGTNPELQFNAVITGYGPLNGAVGNTLDTTLTFTVTGAVTRATSA
jgi:hypothetical protein